MSQFEQQRRRHIQTKGRPMQMGRWLGDEGSQTTATIDLIGFPYVYRPDQIQNAIQQGDMQVEIMNDEIKENGWDAPTTQFYWLIIDGQRRTIQNSQAIFDGDLLIGFSIWCRG
jgi:hypothetical protein